MNTGPNHLPRIDILRAIAIWMVFNSHFWVWISGNTGYSWNGLWYQWDDSPSLLSIASRLSIVNGSLGVSLFFVISGLCIRLSHLSSSTYSTMHFYWRRFWRIYPPYLFALVLFILIQRNASPGNILSHVFLVHNFSTEFIGSINGPFWSLALEFQVYLLYPVLILLHKRFGSLLTGGALFLSSVACFCFASESVSSYFHLPAWFVLAKQLPLTLWFTWYLGFLVADAIVARKAISIQWRLILVASICLFPVCKLFRPLLPFATDVGGIILALSVWEFLSWKSSPQFSPFGKAIATVGACSYSYYLYFDQLGPLCLAVLRGFDVIPHQWMAFVGYPITVLIVFAISFLSYRTMETKSIAFGRSSYEKWLRPRRTPAIAVSDPV